MASRRTVEVEGGVAVVRQVVAGEDGGGVERFAAGAAALEAAAGPGVVELVRSGPVEGGWELVTRHVGQPLDARRLAGPAALAAIGAATARVLADLHERDLTHGALERDHVLVGVDGRPVLSGLGGGRGDPVDDVAALGRILGELARELPDPAGAGDRRAQAAFVSIVEGAAAADREHPASAARLAADLDRLSGAPARPGPPAEVGIRRPPTGPPVRVMAPRAAAVGAAVVAALVVVLVVSRSPDPAAVAPPGTSTSTVPTTSTSLPACVATAGRRVVTGDGCGQVASVDGGVVEVDGRRAAVGRPGDQVVVADWGCEGAARPAVLRPSTGEVLVYAALDGGPPHVERAERVEGAQRLGADLGADGCPTLFALTEAGAVRLT